MPKNVAAFVILCEFILPPKFLTLATIDLAKACEDDVFGHGVLGFSEEKPLNTKAHKGDKGIVLRSSVFLC
jgi:hypothetical protein